jgi:hypothetical protein
MMSDPSRYFCAIILPKVEGRGVGWGEIAPGLSATFTGDFQQELVEHAGG